MSSGSEDGFADICLRLVSLKRDSDGGQHFVARGFHRGQRVGFAVSLSSTWERQDLEESEITVYWGGAKLISLGFESDAFLQALDEVYQTNVGHQTMQDQVSYLAVSLEGYPPNLGDELVRMKLFFESDSEERYAEFYLNIDSGKSTVEFHEKDVDYRKGVVLSLSTGAESPT